eukprot:9059518-Alexandrium_andersonii.AAC.1
MRLRLHDLRRELAARLLRYFVAQANMRSSELGGAGTGKSRVLDEIERGNEARECAAAATAGGGTGSSSSSGPAAAS